MPNNYHYCAVDCYGWAVADTPTKAMMMRLEDSNTDRVLFTYIYKIPLPITASYDFKMYVPDVKGAICFAKLEVSPDCDGMGEVRNAKS